MERPKDSVDLFDLSAKYGSLKEDPAKIIFHQVKKNQNIIKNRISIFTLNLLKVVSLFNI